MAGRGPVTEKGMCREGTEYEVDCLIYSTGFSAVLPPFQAGDYRGRRPRRPDLGDTGRTAVNRCTGS